MVDLSDEAARATTLLRGKQVVEVWRRRSNEVAVQFSDGARLFVDTASGDIELSVVGDSDEPDAGTAPSPPLSIICEHLAEAIEGGSVDLAGVKADLDDVLRRYLAVLEARSIAPPFSYRPATT